MLAIHTKFIPATDSKAAKIKAYTCNGHTVTVSIDYELGEVQRHAKAAKALIDIRLQYSPDHEAMAFGGSADGKGYTFCFLDSVVNL